MSQYKGIANLPGHSAPNVEISEGIIPAQAYKVAPYLPVQRFDAKVSDWKVISAGKVLAADTNNYIVPAGLAIDIETAITAGNFTGCVNVYSATDISEGIKNAAGATPVVGEAVVKSFFTSGDATKALLTNVGNAIGFAHYDMWRQNGAGYGGNPMNYNYMNWNLQDTVAVITRYFIELPVVANTTGVIFPGLTVFAGTTVKPGDEVSYDAQSNFIVAPSLASGATAAQIVTSLNTVGKRILGKVMFVDTTYPKDLLDYVKTYSVNGSTATALDNAPGTATAGLPDNLTYAGVTDPATAKVVRINVII